MMRGTRDDLRLLKVVLTKLWSLGWYSVSRTGGAGRIEAFEVRFPTGEAGGTGDGLPATSLGNSVVVGDSGRPAKYRVISDFCKSALTRRRKGILSCGRRSYIGLVHRVFGTRKAISHLEGNPVILQPRMFAEKFSIRPHYGIFIETLFQEVLQQLRTPCGNRHFVLDYSEHD